MSRSETKARSYAERHHIRKWYTDAQELIDDPDVNVIYDTSIKPCIRHYGNEGRSLFYVETLSCKLWRVCSTNRIKNKQVCRVLLLIADTALFSGKCIEYWIKIWLAMWQMFQMRFCSSRDLDYKSTTFAAFAAGYCRRWMFLWSCSTSVAGYSAKLFGRLSLGHMAIVLSCFYLYKAEDTTISACFFWEWTTWKCFLVLWASKCKKKIV